MQICGQCRRVGVADGVVCGGLDCVDGVYVVVVFGCGVWAGWTKLCVVIQNVYFHSTLISLSL